MSLSTLTTEPFRLKLDERGTAIGCNAHWKGTYHMSDSLLFSFPPLRRLAAGNERETLPGGEVIWAAV